jgi:general stress protein 26
MNPSEREAFFKEVDEACKKSIWCAVATVDENEPRVRIVHPTWEGEVLWFATGPDSPKAQQLKVNPNVDIQYQVAPPDFIHVMVRGAAELIVDPAIKRHAWDAIDYDLTQFGSTGPDDANFLPVRIAPTRVELSEMFGSMNKRVWRAPSHS